MGIYWYSQTTIVASLLILVTVCQASEKNATAPSTRTQVQGECPTRPNSNTTFCSKPKHNACILDKDCRIGFKCCSHPCGQYCALMPKLETILKPGICPASLKGSGVFCVTPIKDECVSDGNCPADLKCCENPCGKYCAPPSTHLASSKPGMCPVPLDPSTVFCARNTKDLCQHDEDCPNDLKCCKNPFGKYCADPLTPIPRVDEGECPIPPPASSIMCARPISDSCRSDLDCVQGFKCCDNPCGRYCAINLKRKLSDLSDKGTCPIPPDPRTTMCALPIVHSCSNDEDCDADVKCCQHPCGRYCAGTLILRNDEKPGLCPRIFQYGPCYSREEQCLVDRDCAGEAKCCSTKCGFTCIPPKNGWYFDLQESAFSIPPRLNNVTKRFQPAGLTRELS